MSDSGLLSKPGTRAGDLQRVCLEAIERHRAAGDLPTSIRFVFYELEQAGTVSKRRTNLDGTPSKRRMDQDVSDAMTVLREAGLVAWTALVDETRSVTDWRSAATVADYLAEAIERARIDCWDGHPAPLILCESRSLAGVLRALAGEYLCPIAATNGQVGGFLRTDIAPLIEVRYGDDAPGGPGLERRQVRYLGDLDRQGGQIEDNTRRVLVRELELDEDELDWERVAITPEQVAERELAPIVKTDRRYRAGTGTGEAWETEALGQGTVVALVREALDDLLPAPLDYFREREDEQREAVRRRLADAREDDES